ncbi:MAG: TolC family protein [Acidiferrobacter sp.]
MVLVLVASLALAACATYKPRPLTPAAVKASLAVRPATALWVRRAHLLLPQLPPLTIRKGQGLTPDLAAIVAVVADPTLRALRAREAISTAQVLVAGLLPNPTFSYGIGVPLSGGGLTEAFRAGLGLPIRSLFTRHARVQAAHYHAQAVDLSVAWQEWQVAARAKTLVYELLVARRERRLLRREVHALRHSVELLSDAEAAGYATVGVAGAARLAWRQTELVRLAVRRDNALKRLQLRALLGVGARAPLRLARHFPLGNLRNCMAAPLWQKGVARRRLDLLALRRGYRSQDAALRAAIAGQFPAITIGMNRARDTSDINTLGGGVALELPIFNHNQGAIALARATRRALFRSYGARLFAARAEIERLVTSMHYLRREIRGRRSSAQALTRMESLYRDALTKHRIAAFTYYQLLEQAVAERLSLLKDKARMDQLAVALEVASGRFEWPLKCVAAPS